jgi:hypothetical protein
MELNIVVKVSSEGMAMANTEKWRNIRGLGAK